MEPITERSTGSDIKKQAARGAVLVGSRTLAVRLLGLAGNLVLARVLGPEEFGVLAVGIVAVALTGLVGDGGFGAALIRRKEEPARADLETMVGYQLLAAAGLVALVAVLAFLTGPTGSVALVMVASVPIVALRSPHVVILERHLNYGPLVRAEVAEVLVGQTFAVTAVLLGAGVWGVASSLVVQSIVGAAILIASTEIGVVRPRLHRAIFWQLAGFGVRIQLLALTSVALIQGLNLTIGALGGLQALGFWSFAAKLIQPAQQVFSTLRQVSYPSMSRLRDAGEDMEDVTAGAVGMIGVGAGFLLVPIAATSPSLIAFAFGDVWLPSADAVTVSLVALLLSGPVSSAFLGMLLAAGFANVALRFGVAQVVVWLSIAALAYPYVGVTSAGVGALGAALLELGFYRWYAPRATGMRFRVGPVLLPFATATAVIALGRWVDSAAGGSAFGKFVVIALGALCVYAVLVLLTQRRTFFALTGTVAAIAARRSA